MELRIHKETWKLAGNFTISRGRITESYVVVVEIQDGPHIGRGECEAHEFDPGQLLVVENIIEAIRPQIEAGLSRKELQKILPSGPARNAVDCALWELEAKKSGKRVWEMAGVQMDKPLTTAYTISLQSIDQMADNAYRNRHRPLLKLKLGASDNIERVAAVRKAAPEADIMIDANEAFSFEELQKVCGPFADLGVSLIEQPLPAGADQQLEHYTGKLPLCADESCLDRSSLPEVTKRYDFINIKLDKTGGLTEALALAREAKSLGLRLMVGCMTATSWAMVPAMVIGSQAEYCDLDGPLMLAEDRDPGLVFQGSKICIPEAGIWG